MATKHSRSGAPGSKKPRHSSAQKKAARIARDQSERATRRASQGKKDDNAPKREAKSARLGEERVNASKPRQSTSPSARPRRDTSEGRLWGGSGERRPAAKREWGGSSERGERLPVQKRDWEDQGRERGRNERSERVPSRRPTSNDHRDHTMRSHRDDVAGRPDRRDRALTERRPSDRERATHEATRVERETPRRAAPVASEVTEDNGFAALGIHPDLVASLARMGIVNPFPIQSATIPDALSGRDLLGRGQTGSGKTMAFGLPMLHRLAEGERAAPHRPHAVILTPTRELAMQILDALRPLMSALRLRYQLIAGGMSYTPQLRSLDEGVDVLVATPGRLSDLIERGAANLSQVKITVLDEADHMAEMGFVEAISEILDLTPTGGQRLLFSATLDHGVDKVAKKYLVDPVTHSTNDATASVSTMDHHLFLVHPHDKKDVTAAIANRSGRTLVFVRTKLGADRIALQLRESGVFAAALHGGLNQAQRTRVLEGFKSGELPVLVATDVAARGIHVDDVSLVLQADPPADHKDYLHRSGRTARAGEAGVVVTLALPHQRKQVSRLLDSAGVQTKAVTVSPEDGAVISTAGGRSPSGEAIPQSRLDAVLRPPRRQSGGRGGRSYGGSGRTSGGRPGSGRASGGRSGGGRAGSGRPPQHGGRSDGFRSNRDGGSRDTR